VLLTFGVDAQLRREAAVDPSHARRYLSGLTVLRLGIGVVGFMAIAGLLHGMGAGGTVLQLFALIAVSQVLLVLNNSYAAYEHAAGDVAWIARTSLVTKLLWAAALCTVLVVQPAGVGIAAVAVGVEAGRFAWLSTRGVRRHGLALRPDLRLASGAIVASLPFFVNAAAHSLYARIGTGWLGAVATPEELGLYGAATNVAAIALLGMPLLSWVLVPSAARAAAVSAAGMAELVASALRIALLSCVPVALVFYVAADAWLALFFGPAFVAAAPVLRILAPTFALAYVSTICAIAAIQQGRIWSVAAVSLTGIGVTVVLGGLLIPWGLATLGPTGGAQGAAWATLGTEAVVTTVLLWIARDTWQHRVLGRTAAALAGGLAAAACAAAAGPQHGHWPFLLPMLAFVFVSLGAGSLGADDLRYCRHVVRRSRAERRADVAVGTS
jgi:O-antigen/teichoic acid export membrane protein